MQVKTCRNKCHCTNTNSMEWICIEFFNDFATIPFIQQARQNCQFRDSLASYSIYILLHSSILSKFNRKMCVCCVCVCTLTHVPLQSLHEIQAPLMSRVSICKMQITSTNKMQKRAFTLYISNMID